MFKPIATVVGISSTPTAIACGAAILLVLGLCLGFRRLSGTTLRAPCLWALLSTAAVAWVSTSSKLDAGIGLSALQFAAAASTLCPLMAILGAKRPQNRGWQWVVLTLWIVVVWPAAQAVLIPTGVRIELFVVWKLFLLGLIVVGLLNYLPTRNGLAAALVATGQLVLLDDYLWNWELVRPSWTHAVGLACFLGAAIVVSVRCRKKMSKAVLNKSPSLSEFDRRWLDFRDAFGTLWALRILARINQTAELREWPMQLDWSGFVPTAAGEAKEPTAEQLSELELAMSTLLRRFV